MALDTSERPPPLELTLGVEQLTDGLASATGTSVYPPVYSPQTLKFERLL